MYVHIDSRNRDKTMYPYSNVFAMDLYTPIKNVTECRLLTAKIPAGPATEPYLFVDVQELRSSQVIDVPSVTTVADTSGKGVTNTPSGMSTNHFVGMVPNTGDVFTSGNNYDLKVTYDIPIDKLSRFTVKVTDFTGKPVNLGTSNVCLVFQLECAAEGSKPAERIELPEPIQRPNPVTKPVVQIPNRLLLIGLAIVGLLIVVLVPKLKRQ